MTNALYFGDNLDVLRESIKDESIDLIYLDPPFNSNATYNVLFKAPDGHDSEAQIEAFDDTWHWGSQALRALTDAIEQGNSNVADVLNALRSVLGDNDMMAYLAMMTVRLIELHRVLKPTGSLYLHCDPTASHYLKMILDSVFGVENYRNEIVWQRTFAHGSAKRWGDVHDTIFFYSKSDAYTWNRLLQSYDDSYVEGKYRFTDERGRYRLVILTAPGATKGDSGKPWRGYDPTVGGRHWSVPQRALAVLESEGITIPDALHDQLELLYLKGFIRFPQKKDGAQGVPEFKFYLGAGAPIQDVITDISPINSQAQERLGYPTQKPLALLERIVAASSNEHEVVLDPFCGCGTAVDAAEKLKRKWIGIDITHLAISLIEKRLRDRYPAITFEVHGTPKDLDGAKNLAERDKHQFEWWALSLVNAKPAGGIKKKGADRGIDGVLFFQHDAKTTAKIVVSVKGGENVSVAMVRDFAHVIDREKAAMGFFVTLTDPTRHMVTESVGTGYYEWPLGNGAKFPKLQVLTIDGLLSGKEQARYPRMDAGALTFKKAKREEGEAKQGKLI
ncbi:MAG: DNA methyltransferase [Casimicrobiaceae bacterium]